MWGPQKKLVNESDISGFINNSDLNKKIETLASRAELKVKKKKQERKKNCKRLI